MQRNKLNTDTSKERPTWIKTGGGSFRFTQDGKKRIIKPGQKFKAFANEIPLEFRDVVQPIDPSQVAIVKEQDKPPEGNIPEYKKVARKGSNNWFDIVNAEGKVQNEKALRGVDADALLKGLNE